jgi:hypothetical protein
MEILHVEVFVFYKRKCCIRNFCVLEILLRERNTMIYVSFTLLLSLLMEMLVWVKTLLRGLVLL